MGMGLATWGPPIVNLAGNWWNTQAQMDEQRRTEELNAQQRQELQNFIQGQMGMDPYGQLPNYYGNVSWGGPQPMGVQGSTAGPGGAQPGSGLPGATGTTFGGPRGPEASAAGPSPTNVSPYGVGGLPYGMDGAAMPPPYSRAMPAELGGGQGTGMLGAMGQNYGNITGGYADWAKELGGQYENRVKNLVGGFGLGAQPIQQGYGQRTSDVMGLLEGLGEAERGDIRQEYGELGGRLGQDLISRGMGGTTIPGSMQTGVTREQMKEEGRLGERLRREQAEYKTRLTGEDLAARERMLTYGTGLQADVTGQALAAKGGLGSELLGAKMGLGRDYFGAMERGQLSQRDIDMAGIGRQDMWAENMLGAIAPYWLQGPGWASHGQDVANFGTSWQDAINAQIAARQPSGSSAMDWANLAVGASSVAMQPFGGFLAPGGPGMGMWT